MKKISSVETDISFKVTLTDGSNYLVTDKELSKEKVSLAQLLYLLEFSWLPGLSSDGMLADENRQK